MTEPAPPQLNDLVKSYARLIIPGIVGLVVSLGIKHGVDLHGYTPWITSGVTFVYYAIVRALEHYVDPRFGWLLALAAKPSYGSVAPVETKKAANL